MSRLWQDRTARHVTILLALKFSLLAALWWGYVREVRLEPDASQVASAVLRDGPAVDSYAPEGAP